MSAVLVDTCVWYAIFDPRDRPADQGVRRLSKKIQTMTIVVPWPVTYETMCTRFTKNRLALEGFERLLKSSKIQFLDDTRYREDALTHSLDSSLRRGRPLSLTDSLLRLILDDTATRIKYFATYNERDFSDVYGPRGIELLN